MTTENRLTREQWDEKRTSLFPKDHVNSAQEQAVAEYMRVFYGPRPDSNPLSMPLAVEWETENELESAAFDGKEYIVMRHGRSQLFLPSVVSVAWSYKIPDDETLTAILALNPNGPVAKLYAQVEALKQAVVDADTRHAETFKELHTLRAEH